MYLGLRQFYAVALFNTADSMDDRREAVAIYGDVLRVSIRVLGRSHPRTVDRQAFFDKASKALADLEAAAA